MHPRASTSDAIDRLMFFLLTKVCGRCALHGARHFSRACLRLRRARGRIDAVRERFDRIETRARAVSTVATPEALAARRVISTLQEGPDEQHLHAARSRRRRSTRVCDAVAVGSRSAWGTRLASCAAHGYE